VILAADPGGTTGWAVRWDDGRVEYGQLKPMPFCLHAHSVIHAAVGAGEHVEVISESFTVRAHTLTKSFQPDALEQIGVLRYLCHWLLDGQALILQQPADAKRLITNDVLKGLGWYAVGMDHARDATRHLAYRCLHRGLISLPGAPEA
jgi:hypothetical protein